MRQTTRTMTTVATALAAALLAWAPAQALPADGEGPGSQVTQAARAYLSEVDKGFVAQTATTADVAKHLATRSGSSASAQLAARTGAYELARASAFRSWAQGHQDTYSSVTSTLAQEQVFVDGGHATVAGPVETTMLWSSTALPDVKVTKEKAASVEQAKSDGRAFGPGQTVTSKVSTRHDITLELVDGAWVVVSDTYLDPFNDALEADHVTARQDAAPVSADPAAALAPAAVTTHRSAGRAAGGALARTITWDRNATAKYADRYWSNYNTAYPNCNPSGGDCANFVSQALWDVTGGDLPTESPYWTPGTMSSCGATSEAWRYTPTQHRFFVANPMGSTYNFASLGKKGTASQTRSYNISSMLIGDVIFEDWTANGSIDHVTIAVAYATDLSTLIDAHNTNRYHYRWDLGTSSAIYYQDKFKSTITYP